MRVAIMQPTFLPWLGYFSLAKTVDVFVFLDSVQFDSRSWQQRNKILIDGQPKWITIPTTLPFGRQTKINDVLINQEHYSGSKISNMIMQAYKGSEGISFVKEEIIIHLLQNPKYLSQLNTTLVKLLFKAFEINVKVINSSSLETHGSKGELLLNISKSLGATTYVSPKGSRDYLQDFQGFQNSNIRVEFQEYEHPIYAQQLQVFHSHLSVIDAICNIGVSGVQKLI